MNVTGRKTTRMLLSEENIDQLFEEAGRTIAAGEGLHRTYWKRFQDKVKPGESKLELFAIMRQGDALPALEKLAGTEFKKLWDAHKAAVAKLSASEKARFQQLVLASGKAVEHEWELPERIVEKPGKHIPANARRSALSGGGVCPVLPAGARQGAAGAAGGGSQRTAILYSSLHPRYSASSAENRSLDLLTEKP